MKRRIISMLMALALCLSLVPAGALAAGDGADLTTEGVTQRYRPDADALPDNDQLFAGYAWRTLYGESGIATLGEYGGSTLTGVNKQIYDQLKPAIINIAASGGSTHFEIDLDQVDDITCEVVTGEKSEDKLAAQIDDDAIMACLLVDCPYELYWFDKLEGMSMNVGCFEDPSKGIATLVTLDFDFYVAPAYQYAEAEDEGGDPMTWVDAGKATAAARAAATAQQVVADNEGKTDYEKLVAYKDYICNAVSYNSDAAKDDYDDSYGDPWQLIYVFDGDSSTNVVCEGYAKAFQYLCDLGGLTCYTVTGTMSGGTGAGNHMWNIVALDVQNYLVDVTNSDEGTVGADGSLFLAGAGQTEDGGYTVNGVTYTYDEDTMALYDANILTLSGSAYTVPAPDDGGEPDPTFDVSTLTGSNTLYLETKGYSINNNGWTPYTGTFTLTGNSGIPFTMAVVSGHHQVALDQAQLSLGSLTIAEGASVDLTLVRSSMLDGAPNLSGIRNQGTLTITADSTGTLIASGNSNSYQVGIDNSGTLVIDGGTVMASSGVTTSIQNSGEVIINGGMVMAAGPGTAGIQNSGEVTINGGNVSVNGGTKSPGIGGTGAVTITGGNVQVIGTPDIEGTRTDNVSLNVITLGGVDACLPVTELAADGTPLSYGLNGVTTTADGKLYLYLPQGAKVDTVTAGGKTYAGTLTDGKGTYTVARVQVAIEGGDTTIYNDPKEAFASVKADDTATITLLDDVALAEGEHLTIVGNVTLVGGDHTLSGSYVVDRTDTEQQDWGLITVRGKGTVTIESGRFVNTATVQAEKTVDLLTAVVHLAGAQMNVNGGTFEAESDGGSVAGVWVSNGLPLIVTGGMFKGIDSADVAGAYGYGVYLKSSGGTLFTGGTFIGNTNAVFIEGNGSPTDLLYSGYVYCDDTTGNYVDPTDMSCLESGTYTVVPCTEHVVDTWTDTIDGATHSGLCTLCRDVVSEPHTFDVDGKCTLCPAEAAIWVTKSDGTTCFYYTLADAMDDNRSQTVTITAKRYAYSTKTAYVKEGDDFTLTAGNDSVQIESSGVPTVCVEGGRLTLAGGELSLHLENSGGPTPCVVVAGGTFCMTGGWIVSLGSALEVRGGDVQLSGGGFSAINSTTISVTAPGMTVGDLLAEGCGYTQGGTWLEDTTGTTLSEIIEVKAIPIQSLELTASGTNLTYGDNLTLGTTIRLAEGVTASYQWYENGELIEGATNGTYNPGRVSAGTHVYTVTATADGYSLESDPVTVTVAPLDLKNEKVALQQYDSPTYNGEARKANFDLTNWSLGGFLQENVDYTMEYFNNINAGYETARAKATGIGNYSGTWEWSFTIERMTVDQIKVTAPALTFNGAEQNFVPTSVTDEDGKFALTYDLSGDTSARDVGTYTAKITATGNFSGSTEYQWTIAKAAAPTVAEQTMTHVRTQATDGALDLSQLLPDNKGETTYTVTSNSYTGVKDVAVSADGKLTYATTTPDNETSDTIKVTAAMQNYEDVTITVQVNLVNKTPVTITGVEAATGLTYNGKAQPGYTGTPTSENYTGDYTITYTGRDGTEYDSATAPTNAGDYTVTIAVPDSDETYAGSITLPFQIKQRAALVTATDKTIDVGDGAPDMSTPALGTDYTVTGLLEGDTLTTPPTLDYYSGENTVTPNTTKTGTYTITPSGADADGNYAISYGKGTLYIKEVGTEVVTKINQNELKEVPSELSGKFSNVEALQAELTKVLVSETGYSEDRVATYDVELQFSLDGGNTWITATEDNFPQGGLTVMIEYPDGTGRTTHDFVVSHMFTTTSPKLGTVAGDTEKPTVIKLADGLQVTLKGLSPVSVAWKTIPTGGGSGGVATYPVTVTAAQGGSVQASPTQAAQGTTVTLTVTHDQGYQLSTLTATDAKGNAVNLTEKGNGQYTLTMPASKVTVAASFAKADAPCDGGATCPSRHFTDVDPAQWYHSAVDYMVTQGLMNGTAPTKFTPNETTTRAMIVTILYRLAGEPAVDGGTPFTDVKSDQWYTDAIAWAASTGVVNGVTPTTFEPNAAITREQLAAMLWRYAGSPSSSHSLDAFTDAGQISGYAKSALAWANETHVVNGKGNGRLDPAGNATRAEAAQMLKNFLES